MAMQPPQGFCLFRGIGLIDWYFKLQPMVAQSVTEAEFMTLTPLTNSIVHHRNGLEELGVVLTYSTNVFVDNTAAIATANNPQSGRRMKHIAVKYFMMRDIIEDCIIVLVHIATDDNPADIGTKSLGPKRFEMLRTMLMDGIQITKILAKYRVKKIVVKREDHM